MADPFSSAATAFGLADIAFRAALKVCNTISRLMTISAELRRLLRNLEELSRIIIDIRNLSEAYKEPDLAPEAESHFSAICEQLNSFTNDVQELSSIIHQSGQPKSKIGDLFWRLKCIFDEKRIKGLSSQIDQHKATLQLGLLTVLGNGGLIAQKALLHVTDKLSCISRGQNEFQTQMHDSVARFDHRLSSIGRGVNTVDNLIRDIQPKPNRMSQETTILLYGSAVDALAALEALYPDFYHTLFPNGFASTLTGPRNGSLKLCSQWHALMSDLLLLVEKEKSQSMEHATNLSLYQPYNDFSTGHENMPRKAYSDTKKYKLAQGKNNFLLHRPQRASSLGYLCETAMTTTAASAGKLSIMVKRKLPLDREVSSNQGLSIGRIIFIPGQESSLAGVVCETIMQIDPNLNFSRTISTFGIHSNDSPIFRYLKARDVSQVRNLLTERKINPNDRDESGKCLIWYALSDYYDYEMCRLLLNEGADVFDCNMSGDDALGILLSKLPANTRDNMNVAEDVLSLIRLLINISESEGYSTCGYKRRAGTEHAQAGLLHCALRRQNSNIRILEVIELILANECDLEERDVNGNTPLLYALYYLPEKQLVEVVWALIKRNANIKAVNKYGEGSLHLMLRRLNACNNYNMNSHSAESMVEILAALLEKGGDPTLSNVAGYTPIDAAMSPTSFPLFCCALERTGRDLKSILLHLDDRDGIVQRDEELDGRFTQVVSRKAWEVPKQDAYAQYLTDKPCYLCGGCDNLEVRKIPFDEFVSRVVDELGIGIHMGLYMHRPDEVCLQVQDEDSSHFLDYCPDSMSENDLKERSWRRHVAERMWHEGILRTPLACQEWAVGVRAEEIQHENLGL